MLSFWDSQGRFCVNFGLPGFIYNSHSSFKFKLGHVISGWNYKKFKSQLEIVQGDVAKILNYKNLFERFNYYYVSASFYVIE